MKSKTMSIFIFLLLIIDVFPKIQAQNNPLGSKNFRKGKLINGVHYFIKDIEQNQPKTLLKFCVKAGARQENSSQLQVAHLLEHVAFKPSKIFPKGISKHILEAGMTPRGINGSSDYIMTSYDFASPTHNKKAILMGLTWFKSIATGLELTDQHINHERGSVKQEFIFATQNNIEEFYAEMNLNAKLLSSRNSFDDFLSHIETFPTERLRSFYKYWYRPKRMAVIIVGNLKDIDAIEKQVKSIFVEIPTKEKAIKKSNFDSLYFVSSPKFALAEVKYAIPKPNKAVEFRLYFRLPELAKKIATVQGAKSYAALQIFINILNRRLQNTENSNPYKSSALNTYENEAWPLSYAIKFQVSPTSTKRAIQHVVSTWRQLKKYGVLQEEWELTKQKFTQNKRKRDARYWQNQFMDYFLLEESLFPDKQKTIYTWINNLSPTDFSELLKRFITSMPDDIGMLVPTGSKALKYTEKQVRSWIQEAGQQKVKPYHMPKTTDQLFTVEEINALKKVDYTDKGWQENGTKEIRLKNGVKVILKPYKPTKGPISQDIQLHGFAKLGAAYLPQQAYYSALNASSIVKYTGVGRYTAAQIESFKKNANIAICVPYIDFKESGIHGVVKSDQAEELLQLVYLYLSKPKFNREKYKSWEVTRRNRYFNNQKNATHDFRNKIRHFYGDSILPTTFGYRYLKSTEAYRSINKTKGKRSVEIYRKIFGQPQKFTFIITGNFKMGKMLPLVRKYLGNLSQNKKKFKNCHGTQKKLDPIQQGPVLKKFVTNKHRMENVKFTINFVKANHKNNPWKETLKIKVLGELTDIMLKRLRYKKGFALYNFGASGDYNHDHSRHKIILDISCQPEELKAIRQECRKIIQEIKNGKVEQKDFELAIERLSGGYTKQALLKQRNIQELLYEQLRYDKTWVELKRYTTYIQSLNLQEIIKLANNYFKEKYRYEFIMTDEPLKSIAKKAMTNNK